MREADRSIGFYINYIGRQSHKYFESEFKQYGIHRGSIFILRHLYNQDGLKQNEICNKVHTDKASITRAIAKMADQGFVRKELDENDSRANRVYLTSKAKKFKPTFEKIFSNWTNILNTNLNENEQEFAQELILKLSSNAENFQTLKEQLNEK